MKVVLTGVLGQFTPRATFETQACRSFKSSRKPASQAGASQR
ncbi:hypothetical protein [Levilactobacillus senmaizukei]|nr:hypothetical protein [Levilactobacillus senmaizukei]